MNVIFDTNILRQDLTLHSRKSSALFAYLDKMKTSFVLPAVVVREAVGLLRRELLECVAKATDAADRFKERSVLSQRFPEIQVDIEAEAARYEQILLTPRPNRRTKVLENEARADLAEMISRLVERRKPASASGQQARDVLVWLAVKRYVRESKSPVVLISANTSDFASKEGALSPELLAELGGERQSLMYFSSLDAFLRAEAVKIEFVTKKWIEDNLPDSRIDDLVHRALERGSRLWQFLEHKCSSIEGSPLVSAVRLWLDDFYVYDVQEGGLYLNLSYSGDVELEIEARDDTRDDWGPLRTRPVTASLELSLSASATRDGIFDVEVDDWYLS